MKKSSKSFFSMSFTDDAGRQHDYQRGFSKDVDDDEVAYKILKGDEYDVVSRDEYMRYVHEIDVCPFKSVSIEASASADTPDVCPFTS